MLERWLSGHGLLLLVQRASIVPSTHSRQLTTSCNFSSWESGALFWLLRPLLHMWHSPHRHINDNIKNKTF